jgi:hypothetical protein
MTWTVVCIPGVAPGASSTLTRRWPSAVAVTVSSTTPAVAAMAPTQPSNAGSTVSFTALPTASSTMSAAGASCSAAQSAPDQPSLQAHAPVAVSQSPLRGGAERARSHRIRRGVWDRQGSAAALPFQKQSDHV